MNTIQRMALPTPRFFRTVRSVITHIAGYVAVAGGVMTAVSQTAVTGEKE